jgi:hypothetical protein
MLLTQVCIVEHCPIELYVFTHRGLKNPDRPSERTDFIATIGERNSDRGIPGGNCFGNACDVRDRPGYACSAIALALAGIAIIASATSADIYIYRVRHSSCRHWRIRILP